MAAERTFYRLEIRLLFSERHTYRRRFVPQPDIKLARQTGDQANESLGSVSP